MSSLIILASRQLRVTAASGKQIVAVLALALAVFASGMRIPAGSHALPAQRTVYAEHASRIMVPGAGSIMPDSDTGGGPPGI